MIKLLITGVWICGVALASVYFSVQIANRKEDEVPIPAMFGGLESVRGPVTSIPVIADGAVRGYFITRLSYTIDGNKAELMTVPVQDLVTDVLYSALVGDQLIDYPHMKRFDLDGFKAYIRDALNDRLGDKVFYDVIVEQIDFLSKSDIRSNMKRGNMNMPDGDKIDDTGDDSSQADAGAGEAVPAPSN